MSWNSGPCVGGPDEEERNVTPTGDDEGLMESSHHEDEPGSRFIEHGGTHFATRFRPNQRKYGPGRPMGTSRESE